MLVARLRPKLVPMLHEHGLRWEDVAPILDSLDTPDEFREALAHPRAFFARLLDSGGEIAKQMALAKLRPMLEKLPEAQGLEWEDLLPAFEAVSAQDLREAVLGAQGSEGGESKAKALLQRILHAGGRMGLRVLMARLRPLMEPVLAQLPLPLLWQDVLPLLGEFVQVERLSEALTGGAPGVAQLIEELKVPERGSQRCKTLARAFSILLLL